MKSLIDTSLSIFLLGIAGIILLFLALATFALPPMMMWFEQVDKTPIMGAITLLVLAVTGLLALKFVVSGKSALANVVKVFVILPFFVFGVMPQIPMAIAKMLGKGSGAF